MKKSSKTIISFLTDFLDWLEIEEGLSIKSQENYARFLKRFFDWLEDNHLSEITPHQLTADHIWQYRVFLSRQYLSEKKQPLKKTTQNYYLIAVRSLLNYFAEKDILSLPSEKVKLAKDKEIKPVRFLTLEQIEKLLSVIKTSTSQGLRDRAILEALFSTGMRISELVALNREQIKFKSEKQELEVVIVGKGNRPRPIYFSERSQYWLKEYLSARKDKEKALFVQLRGKTTPNRLSPRSIQKMIKKYVIMSGLPLTTTPHVMRHSFATDLLSKGVDLRTIQEFLGHKNISATQIYTHVTSKQLKDIHQKFHGNKD